MPIKRLNHAVLYVRDAEASAEFYRGVLGFRPVMRGPGAVFLQAAGSTNDHDLGLFSIGDSSTDPTDGRTRVGLYHLAWEVDTLGELDRVRVALVDAGALVGASDHSTTKSLYGKDPDGLEFEVCWVVPASELTDEIRSNGSGRPAPLDLAGEISRFGADREGGIGVSVPLPA